MRSQYLALVWRAFWGLSALAIIGCHGSKKVEVGQIDIGKGGEVEGGEEETLMEADAKVEDLPLEEAGQGVEGGDPGGRPEDGEEEVPGDVLEGGYGEEVSTEEGGEGEEVYGDFGNDGPSEEVGSGTPQANPIFRMQSLTIEAPTICLKMGGPGCLVDNEMVNAYIAMAIGDPVEPLNVLFRFVPDFVPGTLNQRLLLGHGPCVFQGGKPVSCTFSSQDMPAIFSKVVWPDCDLEDGGDCFDAFAEKVEMWFFSVFMAMLEAHLGGLLVGWLPNPKVTKGYIGGYVPVKTTQSVQITLPSGFTVSLFDLVKSNPTTEINGVKTYHFQFSFEAEGLPYLGGEE